MIVDVHSYKGGVGVTTTACALAAGLAKNGSKVLLSDACATPNVHAWLGSPLPDVGEVRTFENLEFRHLPFGQEPSSHPLVRVRDYDFIVVDNGRMTGVDYSALDSLRICVVKNDYLCLSSTVNRFDSTRDNLVLFNHHGNALGETDVTSVLGEEPCIMNHDPNFQRAIDAGLAFVRLNLLGNFVEQLTSLVLESSLSS